MRRITITALAITTLAALAACSGPAESGKPTSVTPTLSATERTQACIEAIADTVNARPADFDPENDSDPKPAACNEVPEEEYLDAYMKGLQLANEKNRQSLGG